MPDGDQTRPAPTWLSPSTLAVGRAALSQTRMPGQASADGRVIVRDAVLALHPALPFTLIDEAVAYIIGTA